jgi:hypothetical protein
VKKKELHFYVLTEECGEKGASEIIKGLYQFLMNYLPDAV